MKRLFLCSQFYHVADSIETALVDEKKRSTVFIDTCLHDREWDVTKLDWHMNNRKRLVDIGLPFDVYDISGKSRRQIESDLDKYDVMYIEGGNTFYLLLKSLENDFGEYVRRRVEKGMIYISTSAGSIIMGPDIASASRPGKSKVDYNLVNTKSFGVVDFVVHPHWGDPKKKDDYQNYKIPNSYAEDYPYILLTDNQYVEVVDDIYRIVDVTKE